MAAGILGNPIARKGKPCRASKPTQAMAQSNTDNHTAVSRLQMWFESMLGSQTAMDDLADSTAHKGEGQRIVTG